MTDPIKPCPFCGGMAEFEYDDNDEGCGWVRCAGCLAQSHHTDYDNAVERWNRRAGASGPLVDPGPMAFSTDGAIAGVRNGVFFALSPRDAWRQMHLNVEVPLEASQRPVDPTT